MKYNIIIIYNIIINFFVAQTGCDDSDVTLSFCLQHKTYLCINASDSFEQDLYCHFPKCNDFIHNARMLGGGVLVHW